MSQPTQMTPKTQLSSNGWMIYGLPMALFFLLPILILAIPVNNELGKVATFLGMSACIVTLIAGRYYRKHFWDEAGSRWQSTWVVSVTVLTAALVLIMLGWAVYQEPTDEPRESEIPTRLTRSPEPPINSLTDPYSVETTPEGLPTTSSMTPTATSSPTRTTQRNTQRQPTSRATPPRTTVRPTDLYQRPDDGIGGGNTPPPGTAVPPPP